MAKIKQIKPSDRKKMMYLYPDEKEVRYTRLICIYYILIYLLIYLLLICSYRDGIRHGVILKMMRK
jgi:hypothetical protein